MFFKYVFQIRFSKTFLKTILNTFLKTFFEDAFQICYPKHFSNSFSKTLMISQILYLRIVVKKSGSSFLNSISEKIQIAAEDCFAIFLNYHSENIKRLDQYLCLLVTCLVVDCYSCSYLSK